jgi:hypothetical protein
MYYKEKASKIALLIITFFLAFSAIVLMKESNKDQFTDIDNKEIVQAVISGEKPYVAFDSEANKFIGNQAIYKSEYYNLYFLPKADTQLIEKESKTSLVFDTKEVRIYYSGVLLHTANYENVNLDSFSLTEVRNGDTGNIYKFNKMLTVVLNDANKTFCQLSVFNYITTMIMYYFGIVLTIFLFTMLSNPTIGKGVRLKLCCLDSLIFILVFAFQVMYSIPWLIYIAAALPVLYSNVTFMHIIRKVK